GLSSKKQDIPGAMRRFSEILPLALLSTFLCSTHVLAWGEQGILVVHAQDLQGRPVSGLQIGVEGDGGSVFTNDDGKARIPLAKNTRENTWVTLQILKSPRGRDLQMVSPWDRRVTVPSFENESQNFVEVFVVQSGDRDALQMQHGKLIR